MKKIKKNIFFLSALTVTSAATAVAISCTPTAQNNSNKSYQDFQNDNNFTTYVTLKDEAMLQEIPSENFKTSLTEEQIAKLVSFNFPSDFLTDVTVNYRIQNVDDQNGIVGLIFTITDNKDPEKTFIRNKNFTNFVTTNQEKAKSWERLNEAVKYLRLTSIDLRDKSLKQKTVNEVFNIGQSNSQLKELLDLNLDQNIFKNFTTTLKTRSVSLSNNSATVEVTLEDKYRQVRVYDFQISGFKHDEEFQINSKRVASLQNINAVIKKLQDTQIDLKDESLKSKFSHEVFTINDNQTKILDLINFDLNSLNLTNNNLSANISISNIGNGLAQINFEIFDIYGQKQNINKTIGGFKTNEQHIAQEAENKLNEAFNWLKNSNIDLENQALKSQFASETFTTSLTSEEILNLLNLDKSNEKLADLTLNAIVKEIGDQDVTVEFTLTNSLSSSLKTATQISGFKSESATKHQERLDASKAEIDKVIAKLNDLTVDLKDQTLKQKLASDTFNSSQSTSVLLPLLNLNRSDLNLEANNLALDIEVVELNDGSVKLSLSVSDQYNQSAKVEKTISGFLTAQDLRSQQENAKLEKANQWLTSLAIDLKDQSLKNQNPNLVFNLQQSSADILALLNIDTSNTNLTDITLSAKILEIKTKSVVLQLELTNLISNSKKHDVEISNFVYVTDEEKQAQVTKALEWVKEQTIDLKDQNLKNELATKTFSNSLTSDQIKNFLNLDFNNEILNNVVAEFSFTEISDNKIAINLKLKYHDNLDITSDIYNFEIDGFKNPQEDELKVIANDLNKYKLNQKVSDTQLTKLGIKFYSASVSQNNWTTYFDLTDKEENETEFVDVTLDPNNIDKAILTFYLYSKDKSAKVLMTREWISKLQLNTLLTSYNDSTNAADLAKYFDYGAKLKDNFAIEQVFTRDFFKKYFKSKNTGFFSFHFGSFSNSKLTIDVKAKNTKVKSFTIGDFNKSTWFEKRGEEVEVSDTFKTFVTNNQRNFTRNSKGILVNSEGFTFLEQYLVDEIIKLERKYNLELVDESGGIQRNTTVERQIRDQLANLFNEGRRGRNKFRLLTWQYNTLNLSYKNGPDGNDSVNRISELFNTLIKDKQESFSVYFDPSAKIGTGSKKTITYVLSDDKRTFLANNNKTNLIVKTNNGISFDEQDQVKALIDQGMKIFDIKDWNNLHHEHFASKVNPMDFFKEIKNGNFTIKATKISANDLSGKMQVRIGAYLENATEPLFSKNVTLNYFKKSQDPVDEKGTLKDSDFESNESSLTTQEKNQLNDIKKHAGQINGSDFELNKTEGFSYLEPQFMTAKNLRYFLKFTGQVAASTDAGKTFDDKSGTYNNKVLTDATAGTDGFKDDPNKAKGTVPAGQITTDPSSEVQINSLRNNYFVTYYDVQMPKDRRGNPDKTKISFKLGFTKKDNPKVKWHSRQITLSNLTNSLRDLKYIEQDLNNISLSDLSFDSLIPLSGMTPSTVNAQTLSAVVKVKYNSPNGHFVYDKYTNDSGSIKEFYIGEIANKDDASGTVWIKFKYTDKNNKSTIAAKWIKLSGLKATNANAGQDSALDQLYKVNTEATGFTTGTGITAERLKLEEKAAQQSLREAQLSKDLIARNRRLELSKKDALWKADNSKKEVTFTLLSKYYSPIFDNTSTNADNQKIIINLGAIVNSGYYQIVSLMNNYNKSLTTQRQQPNAKAIVELDYKKLKEQKTLDSLGVIKSQVISSRNGDNTSWEAGFNINFQLVDEGIRFTFKITKFEEVTSSRGRESRKAITFNNFTQLDADLNISKIENQLNVGKEIYFGKYATTFNLEYTNNVEVENFNTVATNDFNYDNVTFTAENVPLILYNKRYENNDTAFEFDFNQNVTWKWTQGYKMNLEYAHESYNYDSFKDIKARSFGGNMGSWTMLAKASDDKSDELKYYLITNHHVASGNADQMKQNGLGNNGSVFIVRHSDDFGNNWHNGTSYWDGLDVVSGIPYKQIWDGTSLKQTSIDGTNKNGAVDIALVVADIKVAKEKAYSDGKYRYYKWLNDWEKLEPLKIANQEEPVSMFMPSMLIDYSFSGFPYGKQSAYVYNRTSQNNTSIGFSTNGLTPTFHNAGNSGTGVFDNSGYFVSIINSGAPRTFLQSWKLITNSFNYYGAVSGNNSLFDLKNDNSIMSQVLRANALNPDTVALDSGINNKESK
ncbi:MGA_1079 family surface serine endopeptidase [Mycoplasmopsis agassizii]|uniref:MGA_1079 family surface serine endopeptidase n=1 Tax=Mycoplasmopsis agassizii TaxID=33922 RepID=UPI003528F830